MNQHPKIFISYSSKDRLLSIRLWKDLTRHGADVWQYDESAKPGLDAWEPILKQIEESDFFLVLVSRSSISSPAVMEEIDHAHYSRINTDKQRPTIVPVILEREIDVPRKIKRFGRLDISEGDYDEKLKLLLRTLGIIDYSEIETSSGFQIITPSVGLENIKIGDHKNTLLRECGSPSMDDGTYVCFYEKGIDASIENDRIKTLFFYFRTPGHGTFDGRTKEGIGFISKVSDVLRLYGSPDRFSHSIISEFGVKPGAVDLYMPYSKIGVSFSFYDDELADIRVYKEKPEENAS